MTQAKGKIERGIAYVQDNALKGRRFVTLAAANAHLLAWETGVADTRIHGTTRERPLDRFANEQPPAGVDGSVAKLRGK